MPELTTLVAEHPLRERARGLLMVALYRSGRQAEALRAFREARERLADELGISPGAELTRLHERLLAMDPALDAPTARRACVEVRVPPSRPLRGSGQLPFRDEVDQPFAECRTEIRTATSKFDNGLQVSKGHTSIKPDTTVHNPIDGRTLGQ